MRVARRPMMMVTCVSEVSRQYVAVRWVREMPPESCFVSAMLRLWHDAGQCSLPNACTPATALHNPNKPRSAAATV